MKRRDFIKSALATGGVLGLSPHLLHGRVPSDAPVDPDRQAGTGDVQVPL